MTIRRRRPRRVTSRKPTGSQVDYRKAKKKREDYWKHEASLQRGKW